MHNRWTKRIKRRGRLAARFLVVFGASFIGSAMLAAVTSRTIGWQLQFPIIIGITFMMAGYLIERMIPPPGARERHEQE